MKKQFFLGDPSVPSFCPVLTNFADILFLFFSPFGEPFQSSRLKKVDGVHSMKFKCVGCQLGQVGSKADVAPQVDDMAVPLDEHEGCICWGLA